MNHKSPDRYLQEDSNEIPLSGGRTNIGVVRTGNTVHRPMHPNSEFVQELFQHLKQGGTEQERRFELFLKAYGEDNSKAVIEALLLRQKILMFEGQRLGKVAMVSWAEDSYDWTIKHFWESHV